MARSLEQVHTARTPPRMTSNASQGPARRAPVEPDRVTIEAAREFGPVHVGHQMWRRLGLEAGLSARACMLSEAMTITRLIAPAPSMPYRTRCVAPRWAT